MTRDDLQRLINEVQPRQSGLKNVEVKSSRGGTPRRLFESLSAFANRTGGGGLLFGLGEQTDFKDGPKMGRGSNLATVRSSCCLADDLLFEAGQPEAIDAAWRRSSLGKLLQCALYVVRASALDRPDLLLRIDQGYPGEVADGRRQSWFPQGNRHSLNCSRAFFAAPFPAMPALQDLARINPVSILARKHSPRVAEWMPGFHASRMMCRRHHHADVRL
jgi:hypothetical protein